MQTRPLLNLLACAALAFGAQAFAADAKNDPTGTWTWTTPGRNGGEERTTTLKLKAEGEKLTGKLSSPGRQGRANEVDITDGKIKGDEITFTVVREFNDNKVTTKYVGKVAGDTIKGKTETERDGTPRSRDWEAKRTAEKKSS